MCTDIRHKKKQNIFIQLKDHKWVLKMVKRGENEH